MSAPIHSVYSQYNYFSYYREQLTRQAMDGEPQPAENAGAGRADQTDQASESETDDRSADNFINFIQAFRKWTIPPELLGDDDDVPADYKTEIDGGDGDDDIDADGVHVSVQGGDGDDTINARGYRVAVSGGSGDDTIATESHWPGHGPIYTSLISGDDGNDDITTRGLAGLVNGGEGDDTIVGKDGVMEVFGGSGNDTITAEKGAMKIFGGAGDDRIVSRGNLLWGEAYGGAGADDVTISGRGVKAYGGTGDDVLTLDNATSLIAYKLTEDGMVPAEEHRAIANGGIGDDTLMFKESFGDIQYYAGDGHDTVVGADERSLLKLGPGLTFEDTGFSLSGDDLIVSFGEAGGSITFQNYQTEGLPRIEFGDGRMLDASSTIAYAGGDPDAYVANDGTADGADGGTGDGSNDAPADDIA